MVKEAYDWTPDEKAEIEKLVNRWKEALPVFWLAYIPTYFSFQTFDRITSIIFDIKGSGPNCPPYFPIWGHLAFTSVGLVMFAWTYSIWVGGAKLKAALFYLQFALIQSVAMFVGEHVFVGGPPASPWEWYPVAIPLFQLCFYGPGFLIAAARLTGKRAVTVAVTTLTTVFCIAFFAIVHWGFYLPVNPGFTWKGLQSGPLDQQFLFLFLMAIGGFVVLVVMAAMQVSDKVLMEVLTHEMKERKDKERKRKKKDTP